MMKTDSLRALHLRARALAEIRRFFVTRGYLEVDTPLLAPSLIPERHLEVFATRQLPPPAQAEAGTPPRALFLVPSPELWMKRVLAAGGGSIFQICHCFRNGEPATPLHQPEFTMLEWYTLGADYRDSMDTVEELCAHLLRTCGSQTAALRPPFRRLSMNEAFALHLGTPLEALLSEQQMRAALREHGLQPAPDDRWADGFHKLFLAHVEPKLADAGPVILYDYPATLPTLARRKGDSPWAERWELYARGVELANCYSEETQADALRRFFALEAQAKRASRVPHPPDQGLLQLLEEGLPACSGTALGVDRLLMLLMGAPDIAGTGLFIPPSEEGPGAAATP